MLIGARMWRTAVSVTGCGAAACLLSTSALAHTNSVGFQLTGSSAATCVAGAQPDNTIGRTCYDVEVFYGTWHSNTTVAEGDLAIFIDNGDGTETQVIGQSSSTGVAVPFSMNDSLETTIPDNPTPSYSDTTGQPYANLQSAFTLGTNYYFHDDTATALIADPSTGDVDDVWAHQSAVAVGLGAGTYRIAYDAATVNGLSATWDPQTAIQQLTFTIADDGTLTVTDNAGDTTPPVIDGPTTAPGAATSQITIPENQTSVTTFSADENVTWSIVGGADQALFNIDAQTGAIVFINAPDADQPSDQDQNNFYIVEVQATDDAGNTSTQTLTVEVTDIVDLPSELFEEERSEVERIVRAVETNRLRLSLRSNQAMTNAARDRFASLRGNSTSCQIDDDNQETGDQLPTSELECEDEQVARNVPFDVDGSLIASSNHVNLDANFFGQETLANGTSRRLVYGDFSFTRDGNGVDTLAFQGRVAFEQSVSDDLMWGVFAGASIHDTQVSSGEYTGNADGWVASAGAYMVAALQENLFFEGFASVEAGQTALQISSAQLGVDGDYNHRSFLVGAALSGVIHSEHFELWPELAWTYGTTEFDDANFAASAFSLTENVTMPVRSVTFGTVSFTPEMRFELPNGGDAFAVFEPRVICEYANSTEACGGGISLGLTQQSADGLTSIEARLAADQIGDTETYGMLLSFQHRF